LKEIGKYRSPEGGWYLPQIPLLTPLLPGSHVGQSTGKGGLWAKSSSLTIQGSVLGSVLKCTAQQRRSGVQTEATREAMGEKTKHRNAFHA